MARIAGVNVPENKHLVTRSARLRFRRDWLSSVVR